MTAPNRDYSSSASSSKRNELVDFFSRFWLDVELRAGMECPGPSMMIVVERCMERNSRLDRPDLSLEKGIHSWSPQNEVAVSTV